MFYKLPTNIEDINRDLQFKFNKEFKDFAIEATFDLIENFSDENLNDYIDNIDIKVFNSSIKINNSEEITIDKVKTILNDILDKYKLEHSKINIRKENRTELEERLLTSYINQEVLNIFKKSEYKVKVIKNEEKLKVLIADNSIDSEGMLKILKSTIKKLKEYNIEKKIKALGIYKLELSKFNSNMDTLTEDNATSMIFNQINVYKLGIDKNEHKTYTSALIIDLNKLEKGIEKELKLRNDENSIVSWTKALSNPTEKEQKLKNNISPKYS